MIVTFYSFKGGVGRSMALVNVAEILADRGYRVIACDWDLEAPGLERYFTSREIDDTPWQATLDQLIAAPGLIDLISAYRDSLSMPTETPSDSTGDFATLGNLVVRRPSSVTIPVSQHLPHTRNGWVRLLSAGRRDGVFQQSYAEVVRSFDWEEFYNRWAGGSYVEFVRRDLVNTPESTGAADILLIDSRTGVTEQGGICTHHLADLVVLMTATNDANLAGVQWMAEALTDPRLTALRNDRSLEVLPVAARIEQSSQKEETVDFRNRFVTTFTKYLKRVSGVTLSPRAFELSTEIPYIPFYSFTERVVAREPDERREQNLYDKYARLADAIVENGVARNLLRDFGSRSSSSETTRRARPQSRRLTVYLSTAKADSTQAKVIASGLSRAGLEVLTRADRQSDAWRRANRFVILDEGVRSEPQKAEIAAALRQSILRSDVGIGILDTPVQTDHESFERLAEDIATNDTSLLRERRVTHPGNEPLTEEHAAIFFGRDLELSVTATQWPEVSRWLDIRGDTGIGKTSFVRAGLIPMIRRGEIRGIDENIEILIVRAGPRFRTMLAERLDRSSTQQVVLVIEDCDRLDAKESYEFMRDVVADVFLITTWSSANPLLTGAPPHVSVTLSGLRIADARQALIGPSALARIPWENGLPERVVSDLAEPASAISDATANATVDPALLAAVGADLIDTQTWRVTHKQYDDGGSAGERLARMADAVFSQLPDPSRARALLMRLVTPAGDPRRISMAAALATIGGNDAADVLDKMAELRLIRAGADVTLRHPMLARWWPSLRRWAAASAERVDPTDVITNALALWKATGSNSALPRGKVLQYLSGAKGVDDSTAAFIKFARLRELSRFVTYFAIGVVLFISGVYLQKRLVDRQRQLSVRADADALADRSTSSEDPVRALVLAIAAAEKTETPAVKRALTEALRRSRLRAVLKHDSSIVGANFSADGRYLITITEIGGIEKWDLQTGRSVARQRFEPPEAFDLDASSSSAVIAMNAGTAITPLTRELSDVSYISLPKVESVSVNPTRSEVALLRRSELVIHDVKMRANRSAPPGADLSRIRYTPDGETIIGVSTRGVLSAWTRLHDPRYQPIRDYVRAHRDSIESFAISAAGDRILTCAPEAGGISMWLNDASRPNVLAFARWRLTGASDSLFVPRGAFGNQDKHVLFVAHDGVHVWPSASLSGGVVLKPPIGFVITADFDRQRPRFVAGGSNGRAALCELNANATAVTRMSILEGAIGTVSVLSFSADGSQIVSAAADSNARIWWADEAEIPESFDALLERARNRLPITLTAADQAAYLGQ